jgi:hypothetical protein
MASLENEIGHGNTGLVPWSAFSDITEHVAELAWPTSITTYSRMRTDAQTASLLLGYTLPIRHAVGFDAVEVNASDNRLVEELDDV